MIPHALPKRWVLYDAGAEKTRGNRSESDIASPGFCLESKPTTQWGRLHHDAAGLYSHTEADLRSVVVRHQIASLIHIVADHCPGEAHPDHREGAFEKCGP